MPQNAATVKHLASRLPADTAVDDDRRLWEAITVVGSRLPRTPAFKYRKQHAGIDDCPPASYLGRKVTAYRYVHDPDPNKMSFIPQSLKPNPRKLRGADAQCCGLGLSVYATEDLARAKFESMKRMFNASVAHERVTKILGTHLDELALTSALGVCDEPRDDGHFTFHEYASCNLASVATRVGPARCHR